MKKADQATDGSQGMDAAVATRDCRSCTHFEVGLDGSPYEGYVRCVFDEMERDPDRAAVDPDRFGRKTMISDGSRRKNGGFMPDWIREDVAEYSSAMDCEQFRLKKAEKVQPITIILGTWFDAAKAFTLRTGLELGTPPIGDDGNPSYGLPPWKGCCDELSSFFQSESFFMPYIALDPMVHFTGADDRLAAQEHIDGLKEAVRKFVLAMAKPGRVKHPFPPIQTADDLWALFSPTEVEPGSPEAEQVLRDILTAGRTVADSGPWTPTPRLMEALATILTVDSPTNDPNRPVDSKTIFRGVLVIDLKRNVRDVKGKPLSNLDVGLLFLALGIDLGSPVSIDRLAQRIRGFESAAKREAKKVAEKRRASIPEADSSASK